MICYYITALLSLIVITSCIESTFTLKPDWKLSTNTTSAVLTLDGDSLIARKCRIGLATDSTVSCGINYLINIENGSITDTLIKYENRKKRKNIRLYGCSEENIKTWNVLETKCAYRISSGYRGYLIRLKTAYKKVREPDNLRHYLEIMKDGRVIQVFNVGLVYDFVSTKNHVFFSKPCDDNFCIERYSFSKIINSLE